MELPLTILQHRHAVFGTGDGSAGSAIPGKILTA